MNKILVVDDDPSTRYLLQKILGKKYKINFAADGIECLTQLNNDPTIDLIIIDVSMPVLGGLETIDYIKKNGSSKLKSKPIFVISSHRNMEYLQKAKKLKANAWLSKPPSKKEVLSFVDQFIAT
ncbi:MAG: PleD family two-component system response regulator [Oligoflexales bacterium]